MCHPLSLSIMEDERVLAFPGIHSHSALLQRAFPQGHPDMMRPGIQLINVEVNLLQRAIVLDEHALPTWYQQRHDDAMWRWVDQHMAGKQQFLGQWLPRELPKLLTGDDRHPTDGKLVVAPLGVQKAPALPRELRNRVLANLDQDNVDVGLLVEAAQAMEAKVEQWAAPWEDDTNWTVSFDQALTAPAARIWTPDGTPATADALQ